MLNHWSRWRRSNIFCKMKSINLNLADFLFWFSYGGKECISDRIIQASRTAFLHSLGLPKILGNWFNPPKRTSNYTVGARPALIQLAVKWLDEIVKDEFKKMNEHLQAKQTLTEEELLSTSINDIESICGQHRACVSSLGTSRQQNKENPRWKTPPDDFLVSRVEPLATVPNAIRAIRHDPRMGEHLLRMVISARRISLWTGQDKWFQDGCLNIRVREMCERRVCDSRMVIMSS